MVTRFLRISTRQVRRLLRRLRNEGAKGIISKKVGSPGNRRLPQEKIDSILDFFKQPDHYDFGPTLSHEYITEMGAPEISTSFVRSVMIKNDLWHSKKARELKVHELRPRRSRIGELIQLDSSEHDWFEGRGERCTLLVFIDDATSETLHLKFVKSENTFDYFEGDIVKCCVSRPEHTH